jgi:hypothetical protein
MKFGVVRGLCALSLLWYIPAARAADIVNAGGGVLSQIAAGSAWNTSITLINLTGIAEAYELHFIADDGSAMTLETSAGTNDVITGTLNPGGSVIIQTTADVNGPLQQGWAYVITPDPFALIAGTAIFRFSLPDTPSYEASLPLETALHYQFGIPFDHVNAATGLAIANSYSTTPINVTFTFYDQDGNQFYSETFQMAAGTHLAFMLPDRFPASVAKQGLVLVTGDYYMNVLGLRATSGGLTSITPLVLRGW